jgi:2-oxoisovalerate dehydrogenase E2 component (dihydrolipoyl transacylase)
MKKIFNLPDLGEGLPDAEIVEWHIQVGDTVKVDEPLVSMETAKAVVEVPSPYVGKILALHGKKGDVIITGAPLVEFEAQDGMKDTGTVAGKLETGEAGAQSSMAHMIPTQTNQAVGIKITPAVRALAQKLQVNLAQVVPTGPNGTVTSEDVKKVQQAQLGSGDWQPLKGVRRAMAHSMQQSHIEVVPVTVVDDADVTEWVSNGDITVRLIQAIAYGVSQEPAINAWYHGSTTSRQLFEAVHLGLAMDTADGLFVPLIQDCAKKSVTELRSEINSLKVAVSDRTIPQDQLKGHTILLSNFGKFAGRYSNPMILPPTVAILGAGRTRQELLPVNGDPSVRTLLPLSLTFDHRAVTGGEATRFLGAVIQHLENKV